MAIQPIELFSHYFHNADLLNSGVK